MEAILNPRHTKSPNKTTRNGNKLFEGAKDGKPFKKGVPKTEEQKQSMKDGWARKKVYNELFNKITTNLGIKLDDNEVTSKDLIDALKVISENLGDKVIKQEFSGNLGVEKVFITQEEAQETDNHIDDFIND